MLLFLFVLLTLAPVHSFTLIHPLASHLLNKCLCVLGCAVYQEHSMAKEVCKSRPSFYLFMLLSRNTLIFCFALWILDIAILVSADL
jgi:hypothetical protein